MNFEFADNINAAAATAILQEAIAAVQVPEAALRDIVVTDNFDAKVVELGGQPHAGTDQTIVAGKAIPIQDGDDTVCSVVFRGDYFRNLMADYQAANGNIVQMSRRSLNYHYVVKHEFGHAKDYAVRHIHDVPPVNRNGVLRGVHSAYNMPQAQFDLVGMTEMRFTRHLRDGLRDNICAFLSGGYDVPNPARAFKHDVMIVYWWFLISYAKVVGCLVGNNALVAGPVWDRPAPPVNAIFNDVKGILQGLWEHYPDIAGSNDLIEMRKRLMDVVWTIAVEHREAEDVMHLQPTDWLRKQVWKPELPDLLTV
jgi:hypothetical protein